MTELYDSITPLPNWDVDIINFESPCDVGFEDTLIWNMNIPWTESPAGLRFQAYDLNLKINTRVLTVAPNTKALDILLPLFLPTFYF